jgi:hypothetical protein
VGLVALGGLLRHIDAAALHRLVAASALLAVAIVVPNTITFLLDTIAWTACFPAAERPSFARVLLVRTGGEALTNTLPGGVVVGEVWKLRALAAVAPGTTHEAALGSLALAKLALASSQIAFVCLGIGLGARTLLAGGGSLGGVGLTFVAFLAFFFVPVGAIRAFYRRRGGVAPPPPPEEASPFAIVRAKTAGVLYVLADQVARAFRDRRREVALAFSLSFTGWVVDAAETYLALCALGIPIGIAEAIAIESLGTIFRMVFFLAPGGVGAQDWGLTALLTVFGVPSPVETGASFALVKRAREILWISAGLVIVGALTGRLRRPTSQTPEPPRER